METTFYKDEAENTYALAKRAFIELVRWYNEAKPPLTNEQLGALREIHAFWKNNNTLNDMLRFLDKIRDLHNVLADPDPPDCDIWDRYVDMLNIWNMAIMSYCICPISPEVPALFRKYPRLRQTEAWNAYGCCKRDFLDFLKWAQSARPMNEIQNSDSSMLTYLWISADEKSDSAYFVNMRRYHSNIASITGFTKEGHPWRRYTDSYQRLNACLTPAPTDHDPFYKDTDDLDEIIRRHNPTYDQRKKGPNDSST